MPFISHCHQIESCDEVCVLFAGFEVLSVATVKLFFSDVMLPSQVEINDVSEQHLACILRARRLSQARNRQESGCKEKELTLCRLLLLGYMPDFLLDLQNQAVYFSETSADNNRLIRRYILVDGTFSSSCFYFVY
jgi:hypothetical protein